MKQRGLFILFTALLFACQKEPSDIQAVRGEAFGTTYHIKYKSPEHKDYSFAFDSIFNVVNASMSTYIPTSKLSRINRGDRTVVVDSLFIEVLRKSRAVWKATDGYFDPTIGMIVNAWGFGPDKPLVVPDSAAVDSLMRFVGLQKVHLLADHRIKKDDPRVFLDFNALAKGYTLDLIARYLNRQKVRDYLIEIGGEIRSRGQKRPGRLWVIGIEKPREDGKRSIMQKLTLKDKSMATSGNYRKFRVDKRTGRKCVHIVDPRTGYPARKRMLSASVLAPDCMTADAYATALMAMGLNRSLDFLARRKDLDALLIYDSDSGMKVYTTKGFQKHLEEE